MVAKISDYEFVRLQSSQKKHKKWDAVFINKKTKKIKTVSFGARGYLDFALYYKYYRESEGMTPDDALEKAMKKRSNYLKRHAKEDYNNFDNWYKPSWWARQLLWGDVPNVKKQLKILRKRYNF